jgi:cytochrome c556
MNLKKNLRPYIAVCLCATGVMAGVALADQEDDAAVEKAVEYRQAVMTVLARNTNLMGAMMKNQLPYDKKTFDRLAKDLDAAANLDLLAGFPQGSITEESDASHDIWRNIEDFEQKYYKMQSASNDVKLAAESGDPAKIKPVFFELAKACKACHKAYRN